MDSSILENQIRKQYELFAHAGFWSQLHAQDPKENKLVSRELVRGVEEVVEWAKTFNGRGNLYLGRAARDSRGMPVRVSVFTLDIDPLRPKNTASSLALLAKATAYGRRILKSIGEGYLCSSGNGALLIVPFDRPITDGLLEFSAKCKQFETTLRDAFATEEINVDATQDAARLCRLLGTWNVKGERTGWRCARILSHPVFRSRKPGIRSAIEQLPGAVYGNQSETNPFVGKVDMETTIPKIPVGRSNLPTYDHSVYPTREKAEFAYALRLKLAGLGPEDIRQQLAQYGYIQNPRDAERVISKLFASDRMGQGGFTTVQRSNGMVTGSSGVSIPVEPLWTPKDGAGTLLDKSRGLDNEHSEIGTGFKFLDAKLGGFRPGYVYAVEAPTNVGKSTYITQVANHLARCGKRVLLVITEMDVREAVLRLRGCETGIPTSSIESGRLTEPQRNTLREFDERFNSYQLFIRYTTSPNQAQIEEDIKASKAEVVLWDYFQHFETGNESRQVQLGSLARWFETTAIKYQIPFVVAAQLHTRKGFKDGKKIEASMEDIKDCKVLNDVSKTVIVLDWDESQFPDDGPIPLLIKVQKNKGPSGKGTLRLVRRIPRFEEL